MVNTTRFHYLGDKQRAPAYRGAGQATLGKLRDQVKFNDIKHSSYGVTLDDGTTIVASTCFGKEDVFITPPEVSAKQPVPEVEGGIMKKFIVIFCNGREQYIPVGNDPGEFAPMVITPWYAIVYDLLTKTYAEIPDPVPEDGDENGNIVFPCSAEKVAPWWNASDWISKKDMSRELGTNPANGKEEVRRTFSENWKVWKETFSFVEILSTISYTWGPNKSENSKGVDCDCPSYPKKYDELPCFYNLSWSDQTNLWICKEPAVSDTGYCDYRYLAGPFGAVLLSDYQCYEAGFCNFQGSQGYGSQYHYWGERSSRNINDTMVSITPGSVAGSAQLDYNALGYGFFGAALLTCDYLPTIISSYHHERNAYRDKEGNVNRQLKRYMDYTDKINVYTKDETWTYDETGHYVRGRGQILGGDSAQHVLQTWTVNSAYTYTIGNILYTPIGTKSSMTESVEMNNTDTGTYHYKVYGIYHGNERLIEDRRRYVSNRDENLIPDITMGDLNVFNCYRRNFSLTTESQEVLCQFYMWHYMLVHEVESLAGRTASSGTGTHSVTHSWGHTLLAQAEFSKKQFPNPLLSTDYAKVDDLKSGEDFAFNTTEFETEMEALIAKVYGERGYPLILEFDPYIVEAGPYFEGTETGGNTGCAVCRADGA